MKYITLREDIQTLISGNKIVMVYFGSKSCNVCSAVKPKIEEILKNYPEIKNVQVDTENSLELAAFYNIYTIPVILLFIDGKEVIREARYFSMQEVNNKIERYYEMLFN